MLTYVPSDGREDYDATCEGTDDGTGADCRLNVDGTACEVMGGDCVYTDAIPGVDAEILKAAVVGVAAVWIGFMYVVGGTHCGINPISRSFLYNLPDNSSQIV